MKTELINEIAFLYETNSRYWTKERLCQFFNLKPVSLGKAMQTEQWKRIARIVLKSESIQSQTDDYYFQESHKEKLDKYLTHRESLGAIQAGAALRMTKVLLRAIDLLERQQDNQLMEYLKDYSHTHSNLIKSIVALDDQAIKNSHDGLAIDMILESLPSEPLPEPRQLRLFE